jgi:hypothetical protein
VKGFVRLCLVITTALTPQCVLVSFFSVISGCRVGAGHPRHDRRQRRLVSSHRSGCHNATAVAVGAVSTAAEHGDVDEFIDAPSNREGRRRRSR